MKMYTIAGIVTPLTTETTTISMMTPGFNPLGMLLLTSVTVTLNNGAFLPNLSPSEGELIIIIGSIVSFMILTPTNPIFPTVSLA